MAETQRRSPGARVEDTWYRKDKTPKARNGVGKRWRVVVVSLEGDRAGGGGYFERKVDAENHRDAVNAKLLQGDYVTERAGMITVEVVYEEWLTQQAGIADSTQSTREITWETWVSPKWRKFAVRDVRKSQIRTWVTELTDDGAGPATIENAVGVLRMVLALAVEDKRLAANPATGIKLPPRKHRPRAYLTHEQVWELAGTFDPRYRMLVLFLAYTGLRFGEVAALEVRDIDFLRRRIEVRQQVTEVEGRLTWTPTKGKRRRSVPFPKFLVDDLSVLCVDKKREDQVFQSPKGGTLRLNSWRRRIWNPTILKLREVDTEGVAHRDFPAATPHDMRHTAASLAISANANVKAVQTMLGHKSAALTLDTYSDLFPADLDGVAAAFDREVEAMVKRAEQQEEPEPAPSG
ncbi:site-specific integrase [Mycobacteroides abscessus subsp. massiliense]|uniref:tyrosine-type recombinase/integrase n=1 Tax=Mycobacteroides abscessus TaxID=36809 RepID=UPI0019CFFB06|nr:site-specific integrase [Mycobacteroides abscessus]MBN7524300.1 site-specific integrase [Mycobacteroides abscessus subsp. massiliense]